MNSHSKIRYKSGRIHNHFYQGKKSTNARHRRQPYLHCSNKQFYCWRYAAGTLDCYEMWLHSIDWKRLVEERTTSFSQKFGAGIDNHGVSIKNDLKSTDLKLSMGSFVHLFLMVEMSSLVQIPPLQRYFLTSLWFNGHKGTIMITFTNTVPPKARLPIWKNNIRINLFTTWELIK